MLTLKQKLKILNILFDVKNCECYGEVMALKAILKIIDQHDKATTAR
jgi:hypothetical protein